MNSRSDWLVLSDYYSVYVTNDPPRTTKAEQLFQVAPLLFFADFSPKEFVWRVLV